MITNGATAGPGGLRRLALHERHMALDARMAPFAGWEMPLQYEGILAEHTAVRERVGVFDVSHLARVWVRGPEAGRLLRSVTTFDVTSLTPGRAHYSLYCNEQGGIEDDVFIYRVSDDQWLVVHNAANADADLSRVVGVAGKAVHDATGETSMLAVQGPRARSVLGSVLGQEFSDLKPRECADIEWTGGSVLVARTGYTGEDGAECIVPTDRAATLWDALLEAGAAPAGLGARDTLRLEAALPLHGNDIDGSTTPYEAGLGFALTLDDGEAFTGRSALASLADAEPARRLAHLRATERGVFRAGYSVMEPASAGSEAPGAAPVATLTSGAFSPTLRVAIGMAYLPQRLISPGTKLIVDVRGRPVAAEVVRRPFYRRARRAQQTG